MEKRIDEMLGDGGDFVLSASRLQELRGEIDLISADLKNRCLSDEHPDEVRFSVWAGQSGDGLKHKENYGATVKPFDGSMDSRDRSVDMLINEDVMLSVAASSRARMVVSGRGASDTSNAGNMQVTLRYFLNNKMGLQWIVEQCRLANYVYGSAPGMGFLSVDWRQEDALELRVLLLSELRAMYLESALSEADPESDEEVVRQQIEELVMAFDLAVYDPLIQRDVLSDLLSEMFPTLKLGRRNKIARSIIRQLAKGVDDPEVEFPVEYRAKDELVVRAMRVGGEVHLPVDARDFQESGIYFMVENMTRTALQRRARAEGWSKEFVTAVLGTSKDSGLLGEAVLQHYKRGTHGEVVSSDSGYLAKRYQILTVVMRLANEEGVDGIYYVPFHYSLPMTAHELRLSNYKHGKFPGVLFVREYISGCLSDSRGIPELHGSGQNQRKTLLDGIGNNALLSATPPITSVNRQGMGRLYLDPLKEIRMKRDGQLRYLSPPAVPEHVMRMVGLMDDARDDYFGRANEHISASRTVLHQQHKVMLWLGHYKEVLVMMMQLIQQFASDELIARVTDQSGLPFMRSREEIQGLFDLELIFDPADLEVENLKVYGELVKNIVLAMDTNKTIDTTSLVADMMYRLNPALAASAVRSTEEANESEALDESRVLAGIRAGVEASMPDDGSINYSLRLEFYKNKEAENGEIFADMAEDKRVLLVRRMEFLAFQAEQFGANAAAGRTGVSTPVFEEEEAV